MATVQAIVTDALQEVGAFGPGETPPAADLAFGLLRFQNQLDTWQADRLTLSLQARISYTIVSGDSSVTIGPAGGDITAQRPVWIDQINYVIPASSPEVETPMAPLDEFQYAAITIKELSSSLPQQYFYQTDPTTVLGTIFFWPQVNQNVKVYIYAPRGIGVPALLADTLLGPPGYQEAFMYQLAIRLWTAYRGSAPLPALLPELAQKAWANMVRPNITPGLLGTDPAVVPVRSGGYNILSDSSAAPGVR
jgi:hypothetical protein